jgi:Tfp pilus assembly protein PilN
MDLNKEIKLSDLFRRKPKEATADPAETAAEPKEKGEGTSFFKREISFGRKPKGEKPPKEPRAKRERKPKEPKAPRRKRGEAKADAPSLPSVPLMRAFNLMPADGGSGADSGGRRPSTAQLVLAVVGLVLVAVLGAIFLISNAQVADKQAEVDELKTRLAGLEQPQEEPVPQGSDATLVQERDNRTLALGEALANRVAWDRLLRDVSLVLPEDAWLDTLTANAAVPASADPAAAPAEGAGQQSTFTISGFARKQESVAELLSRLTVLPQVASVQLVSATATEVGGEDVVQFQISGTLKSPVTGATT